MLQIIYGKKAFYVNYSEFRVFAPAAVPVTMLTSFLAAPPPPGSGGRVGLGSWSGQPGMLTNVILFDFRVANSQSLSFDFFGGPF